MSKVYNIDEEGNFEGRNHLIRRNDDDITEVEEKLLAIRKRRPQPAPDNKILCGINALTAVALIQAGRNLDAPELEEKTSIMIRRLIDVFWDGRTLGHSFYRGAIQKQSFLFDAAALLTAVSMICEDDASWDKIMTALAGYVESFKEGRTWIESRARDFQPVFASWFDHPVPSSVSLAEMGQTRVALLTGKETHSRSYRAPHQADFFNIVMMMQNGLFHVMTSPGTIPWTQLPANTLQKRGEPQTDCYRGTCKILP